MLNHQEIKLAMMTVRAETVQALERKGYPERVSLLMTDDEITSQAQMIERLVKLIVEMEVKFTNLDSAYLTRAVPETEKAKTHQQLSEIEDTEIEARNRLNQALDYLLKGTTTEDHRGTIRPWVSLRKTISAAILTEVERVTEVPTPETIP